MNLKITKEITLTETEIKDIIIKHLHLNYALNGIFDVNFILEKKSYPSKSQYPQDYHYYHVLTGAKVRISENE